MAAASPTKAQVSPDGSRPNVIIILADDLGYGDLGCYGSQLNDTPNLDRMAAGGLRLTDFHSSSWCAPSRCALMTGCHPNRPGLLGDDQTKLAESITMAEMLKNHGYTTALVGKWHLGMAKGLHPLEQGFDSWYGTRGSNDWDGPRPNHASFREAPESAWKTPIYRNRKQEGICPQSEFTQRYTREAVDFVSQERDEPFFLYLAHNMPHVPVFASAKFKGKSKNGVYGDVVAELDWSTGEILKALEATGISENTLVIFASDNGPWTMFPEFAGIASPLRGEKSTTWEGGVRVPAIFYWPKSIKPSTSAAFTSIADLYATVAAVTGAAMKAGQAIDSNDLSPVIFTGAESPRSRLLFYHHRPMAYRNGDHKIHFFTRERTRHPETGAAEPPKRHDPPLLFNLAVDAQESKNIAQEHPRMVERLTAEYEQAQQAIMRWERYQ